jgi:peroxiredoxin
MASMVSLLGDFSINSYFCKEVIMRLVMLFTVLMFVILGALNQLSSLAEEKKSTAVVGSPAPDFTLEDQNGNQFSLSGLKGKIIVLEWLNPDCPFVQRHYRAKTMTILAEKYKSNDVAWVAINSTHYMNKEDDRKWIDEYKLSYSILDDNSGKVGRLYGAKTTPHMFIIDESGTLVYRGAIDDDPKGVKNGNPLNYVDKALEEVIAGKQVSISETKSYGCSVKYAD